MYFFNFDCNNLNENNDSVIVLNNDDGTVCVWVNDGDGIFPIPMINTKTCCEALNAGFNDITYTFDELNQKCLWKELPCDRCEFKVTLNPKGNDGVLFTSNEADKCSLDISLEYLFKFDCEALKFDDDRIEEECDDAIKNLENFDVCFTLDVFNDVTGLYDTIYEEPLFNIGEGNLVQYIIDNSPNTGIIISGDSGVLPPYNSDLPSDETCDGLRDAFVNALYVEQYKPTFGEPNTTKENDDLLALLSGWYNSPWLTFDKTISDTIIIDQIKNKKIKISFKVKECCSDFSILVDKVKLVKKCASLDNQEIQINEPPKFEIERVPDNKKSWVSNTVLTERDFDLSLRGTEYKVKDERLVINTKEVDLRLDAAAAIETDVWCYADNNDCLLATAEPYNYVFNGDFALGTVNSTPTGWGGTWIKTSGEQALIAAGVEPPTFLSRSMTQTLSKPLLIGSKYRLNFDLLSVSSAVTFSTNVVGISNTYTAATTGETFVIDLTTATTSVTDITFTSSGFELTISLMDNISIYEILTGSTCGDKSIDLDSKLTTEISAITTIQEFERVLCSELIDAKNRQSLSAYPTLRMLYNRYLGLSTACDTPSNMYDYCNMQNITSLIGDYWIDLVEQVVPSTTLWGSTNAYRNTIFDKQKHKYRRNTVWLCSDPSQFFPFSPVANDCVVEVIKTNIKNDKPPTSLTQEAQTITFQTEGGTLQPSSDPESLTSNITIGNVISTTGSLVIDNSPIITDQTLNNFFSNEIVDVCNCVWQLNNTCGSEFIGRVIGDPESNFFCEETGSINELRFYMRNEQNACGGPIKSTWDSIGRVYSETYILYEGGTSTPTTNDYDVSAIEFGNNPFGITMTVTQDILNVSKFTLDYQIPVTAPDPTVITCGIDSSYEAPNGWLVVPLWVLEVDDCEITRLYTSTEQFA